ncbi:winged helix-turn-helix transcriptional regulator [Catenulispora sp. NF23]|uniref:Winged helix-turn-helix transcriptional regulator n=1 Tax=Catenulispora pinistramenti TaxID=2705254 RepID=A0ABS5KSF0_9ACTN|nr:MarR family winged helix-turn-helix transcriptional regulator [Catenulispora pinistramenti]MBS2532678.1 winged helix-turn-helix transcriptional regulator [Catenulispora pinistramenti]MBS2548975.1 winged helix-turn-helix transcriptional regulator [Catenulispora pinistramenti]
MPDATPLDPEQLAAYFALMEVGNLLQHAVDQQLRDEGGLSFIQFQILAVLSEAAGGRGRMTDVADRLVHSRSGLTYQVSLLAEAGLVAKEASAEDERGVVVTLTAQGRDLLDRVMPGHIEVVQRVLFTPLSDRDVAELGDVLGRIRAHMRTLPPRSAALRRRRGEASRASDKR